MNKMMSAAAAGAGVLLGYAAIENTLLLRTVHYETALAGMPRTVLISDLHKRQFGAHQHTLIRRIADLKPEYILIAGDLISRTVTDFSDTDALLRRLCAIAPVIMSDGNHEADLPPSLYRELRQCAAENGVLWLHNSYARLGGLTVAGLALSAEYYRGGGKFGFRGKYDCTAETMKKLLGVCPENTLLIAHNPLFFPAYAEWGAALTVAGHVHGGIVRLPVLGGILSPERKFFPQYDKGQYMLHGAEMVVSGGLGKLRLFNPPEICLLTSKSP